MIHDVCVQGRGGERNGVYCVHAGVDKHTIEHATCVLVYACMGAGGHHGACRPPGK